MTAGHAIAAVKVAAAVRCHDSELLGRGCNLVCFRMVFAHQREPLADSVMRTKLFNNAGPDSVLLLLHQLSIANDEHPVLRSRQKYVRAVG